MGTSAFLTLLVCVHVVAGSPKSCPDADKPVEVIALEIGSHEEAVSIMGCDSVSVDKGNELKKLRQVSKLFNILYSSHPPSSLLSSIQQLGEGNCHWISNLAIFQQPPSHENYGNFNWFCSKRLHIFWNGEVNIDLCFSNQIAWRRGRAFQQPFETFSCWELPVSKSLF